MFFTARFARDAAFAQREYLFFSGPDALRALLGKTFVIDLTAVADAGFCTVLGPGQDRSRYVLQVVTGMLYIF